MKKINIHIVSAFFLSLLLAPAIIVSAEVNTLKELVNVVFIDTILKPIVPLLIGVAVVVFIYGVLISMFSEGGEKKEEGKQYMFWGIIGIFVMVSLWGLVAILDGTFQLDNNTIPNIEMRVPVR